MATFHYMSWVAKLQLQDVVLTWPKKGESPRITRITTDEEDKKKQCPRITRMKKERRRG